MSVRAIFFGVLLAGLLGQPLAAQVYEGEVLVTPTMLADRSGVAPGETFRLGVLLEMAPGWHTYWRHPGDGGMPTTIDWQLPEGFERGEREWPIPKRLIEPGDLEVYAYKDQVLFFVEVTAPEELEGDEISFAADASWLVCEKICIPGDGSVELTLPVEAEPAAVNAEIFEEFEARLPKPPPPPFEMDWERDGSDWMLRLSRIPEAIEEVDFFPFEDQAPGMGHAKPQTPEDGEATLRIPNAGTVEGLVVARENGKPVGWPVESPEAEEPAVEDPVDSEDPLADGIPPVEGMPVSFLPEVSLWTALLFGVIGGFILNLMPCVLPVISLKVFGFIRQAGESRARIVAHGLSFCAGIFLWFLGLGVVVALMKTAGAEVTWAFQFQNPWFMLFISAVVFVFALNLFGVFEIVLPGQAVTKISEAGEQEGLSGSFFQGIFATLLATPCTAPFLGTALGFAFAQPVWAIFAMFAAISFGMALPYLVLSAQPAWVRFLPKPGTWMETLKQFMGFPLMATLLWLLFVIGGQKGTGGIIWAGSILLSLALAVWLYGAYFCKPASRRARWIAGVAAIVIAVGGSWFFGGLFAKAERTAGMRPAGEGEIAWVEFSKAKLDELLDDGQAVFIDFTADWCLTCKFNERTAINTPAVRALLQEKNIVPMKADWTNSNPEITAELARFGRVGVPFYVYYPAGKSDDPVVLPELLTESIVLDRLGSN